MSEEKSIRFAMLVSPKKDREDNALRIKERIPSLELVAADKDKCDLFTKHLETLATSPEEYKGVVMMEDDIILSRTFEQRFAQVMSEHQSDIVQFFERALAKKPLKRGYANGGEFYSCVCYYMPAEFTQVICSQKWVDSFRAWFPKLGEPWNYPIDTYIQYVLRNTRMIYWREFPFIVQHGALKSNFKGRPIYRQSRFFVDDLEAQDAK